MNLPSHAGGEFVFVKTGAPGAATLLEAPGDGSSETSGVAFAAFAKPSTRSALQDAVALADQGAVPTKILASVPRGYTPGVRVTTYRRVSDGADRFVHELANAHELPGLVAALAQVPGSGPYLSSALCQASARIESANSRSASLSVVSPFSICSKRPSSHRPRSFPAL